MPHHWTRIGPSEELADASDKIFRDEDTGDLYVLGKVHKNATKDQIARWYKVDPSDVTFPLEEQ